MFYNIDLYLTINGINNYFYDIVFDVEINKDTYDFNNEEFFDNFQKDLIYILYILFNVIILIGCIFVLIFIVFPIIKNKKKPKKRGRFTRFKEKIENNEEQFDINERFTADPV